MASHTVSCEWVKENLGKGNISILDCHYVPTGGYSQQFVEQHIDGAQLFDMEKASVKTPNVTRELIEPKDFEANVRSLGVNNDTHVILYDHSKPTAGFFSACRGWFLLKYYGHIKVSIMDGGLEKWISLGFPVSKEVTPAKSGNFTANVQKCMAVGYEDFIKGYKTNQFQLVDTRPPKQFQEGEAFPVPGTAGFHLPGATNVPVGIFLGDGLLNPKEAVAAELTKRKVDVTQPICVICNSAMQACGGMFLLDYVGAAHVQLFNGSYKELGTKNPEMITAKGE